ncbi:MAG: BT4734/BF3469 family protein [Parabacteroides merdae]
MPISSETTPSEITLDRVYRLITTDSDLRDRTEKFRFYLRVGNKQMSACEKTSCPAFTPAVRCEGGRKRMHIKAYTGLSLCDLDHIPEERMAEAFAAVCADPHVLLAYHTISGRGLRVIYAFLFEDGSSVADADPADRKTLRVYQEGYRQGNELSPASPGWNTTAVARIPNGSAVRLMIRTPVQSGSPAAQVKLPPAPPRNRVGRKDGRRNRDAIPQRRARRPRCPENGWRTKESAMSRATITNMSCAPATSSTSMACRRRRPSHGRSRRLPIMARRTSRHLPFLLRGRGGAWLRAPAPERWRQRQMGGRRGEQAGRGGGDRGVPVFAGGVPPQCHHAPL